VTVALMAALTFVFTFIRIEIPTPIGKTMIHLGNVMCLLSTLLFGPLKGALSAGLGSMIFDLFDPVYITQSWVTFINKFVMALVAGVIYHGGKKEKEPTLARSILAASLGALSYTVLYTSKQIVENSLILGVEWGTVWASLLVKVPVSFVNGIIAAICSVLLNMALRPALKKAGLSSSMQVR
jgi:uncharacterized membrane protein